MTSTPPFGAGDICSAPSSGSRPLPQQSGDTSTWVPLGAVGLAITGIVLAVLVVPHTGTLPTPLWSILSIIVGVVSLLRATAFRRGAMLSPYAIAVLLLVSIYGVRPLFMISRSDYDFYGIDIISGFDASARIGFAAVVMLTLGYIGASIRVGHSYRNGATLRTTSSRPTTGAARDPGLYFALAALVALVGAWIIITAIKGGSLDFLAALYNGRSSSTTRALAGLPVAVSALPVAGAIVLCAARVTIDRRRTLSTWERTLFWLGILATTIPPLALGTRRFLLPCLLAAAITVVRPRAARRASPLMVIAVGVSLLLLAIVPFVRSAGSRQAGSNLVVSMARYFERQGVFGTLEPFFVSYDTEMFNYVAYVAPRLGDSIPYGWGRGTLGDLVLNPFPAALAPTDLWSDKLLTFMFGSGCATGVCPVPSIAGVLTYDLGPFGLVAGMAILGWACRYYEPRLQEANGASLIFLLTLGAYTPVIVRGASMNATYLMLCSLAIALVVWLTMPRGIKPTAKSQKIVREQVRRPTGIVSPGTFSE